MMRQYDSYRQNFSRCGTTMIQQGAIIDGGVWRMADVYGAYGGKGHSPPSNPCQVTWLKR